MSRGYRCILIALAGLAGAGNVQPVDNGGCGDGGAYASEAEQSEAPRRSTSEQGVRAPDIAAENERHAAEERQRGRDDLVAQQVTARWTRIMAMVAIAALLLSTIGVLLIFVTFKAARDQVNVSKDAITKQLRAYIGIEKAEAMMIGKAGARVFITVRNFGQTPAFEVRSFTQFWVDTHHTEYPGKIGTVILAIEFGIIEPGQMQRIWLDIPEDFTRETGVSLLAEQLALFVSTRVQYADFDKVDRSRTFCHTLPRGWPLIQKTVFTMAVIAEGNDAA